MPVSTQLLTTYPSAKPHNEITEERQGPLQKFAEQVDLVQLHCFNDDVGAEEEKNDDSFWNIPPVFEQMLQQITKFAFADFLQINLKFKRN